MWNPITTSLFHSNQKDPGMRRLDDYKPKYIPKALRKNKFVKFKPRVNTEHLYKYDDYFLVKRHYPDDGR